MNVIWRGASVGNALKVKSREPLWLPYILGEQNSIDITTNDVKSLRNPIRTNTVYIQHCIGTQMASHT